MKISVFNVDVLKKAESNKKERKVKGRRCDVTELYALQGYSRAGYIEHLRRQQSG